METARLSQVELAEYCRQRDLFVEQVESWRDACMQANAGVAQEATRLQKKLRQKDKEIKRLQRNLRRKETAALLVLQKRADAIGGRRRLISASNRKMAIELIEEATAAVAGAEKETCGSLH